MIDISKLKSAEECRGRLKELVGNEGLTQLAQDGSIPHYIIENPVTKEKNFAFIPNEINEWFAQNYIQYNEGYYKQSYNFFYFDKSECVVTHADQMPDELSKIEDVYKLPFAAINTPPGIYFLCKGKQIKYIGQAVNVSARIAGHLMEGVKGFDSAYFIVCPINRLNQLEEALIRYLKPECNKTFKADCKERDTMIVEGLFKSADGSIIQNIASITN